jgi:Caspase domain
MTNRAFLVGIDDYPGTANDLNSCIQDTVSFEGLLSKYYGFSDSEIRRLQNENATLANVREGLEWLIDGAVAGDRRVYFQSSHGYRYIKDGTLIEVLVLGDGEFFEDHELVQLTEQLPAGVLTVAIDACHSGGLDKVFLPPNMLVQVARAKVFQPELSQLDVAATAINEVTSVKLFGRSPTADPGALAKNLALADADIPPAKDLSAGESELNGVLFSACRADETAAAGTAITSGLSAFTFALTAELDPTISVTELHDRVVQRLQDLHMRQTPVLAVRPDQQDLLLKTFISEQAATSTSTIVAPSTIPVSGSVAPSTIPVSGSDDELVALLRRIESQEPESIDQLVALLGTVTNKGKGIKMAKDEVGLKDYNWEEVVALAMKSKDFAPSSAVSAAQPGSKDWLDTLTDIPWTDVFNTGMQVFAGLSKSKGIAPEKGWDWLDDVIDVAKKVPWETVATAAMAAVA